MMMGKAAMVIRGDTRFFGPYADTLNGLGAELNATYAPVHTFLSNLPSIVAWPVASSTYEAVAQFSVLNDALAKASNRTGLSQEWLREELGRQAIEQNFTGFLQLSLLNYFGQWSVTALTFPPAARAFNSYVNTYPNVPLEDHISSSDAASAIIKQELLDLSHIPILGLGQSRFEHWVVSIPMEAETRRETALP